MGIKVYVTFESATAVPLQAATISELPFLMVIVVTFNS